MLVISEQEFSGKGINYSVRSANESDAKELSDLRVQIDGETDNLDREKGEAFIDTIGFKRIIKEDAENPRNLFLVAVVHERIVGFSRCEGNSLNRFSHKVEFGVCVLKEFWGHSIGKTLLSESISWADSNGIKKIALNVTETNEKAIKLYKELDFKIEGVLQNDKILADGKYYNTVLMGRFNG